MKKIKNIADKIFRKSSVKEESKGIYATLEDLVEQKQYTNFINYHNKKTSYSRTAGDIKSAFKGRGMEFAEIRAYEYGDEVRDIDWRVTARKTVPYTKIYHEEKNRDIYVFLDLSPSMVFGTKKELKSVSAAKIAALLGWVSFENKDKFGCFIFDGKESFFFKPQNSRANLLAILKKISDITKNITEEPKQAALSRSFEINLKKVQKNIKSKAAVFLISDFYNFDDKVKKSLVALSRKGSLFLIDVFDKVEEKSPMAGEYMINNGSKNVVFDTRDKGFKDGYAEYFVHKNQSIKEFCTKFSCKYMSVTNALPIFRQIKLN